jgi:hypothetical protein
MNTWMFYNNDIFLMSSDPQQLEMANQWIARLKEAIRDQVMEEVNGRTANELDRNELPEVTC